MIPVSLASRWNACVKPLTPGTMGPLEVSVKPANLALFAFVLGVGAGTLFSAIDLGSGRAVAADAAAARVGSVLPASGQVTKQAGHGKARITELALGDEAFVGVLELDADVSVPEHQDPTEEVIHVLEGSGVIHMDGKRFEVGPGDTIYMPAGATVSYDNGGAPMKAFQVFGGPGPASKYESWTPVK